MASGAIHPRVSINLVSGWTWSLAEHLAFLRELGSPAISVTSGHLGERPDEAVAAIRQAGLTVVSAGTGVGSLIDSGADTLARLTPIIDAADALGSPSAFTVTGPTPARMPTEHACARLVETIAPANAYATERGVRLAIEHSIAPRRAHGFVCTLADAVAVAADADLGVVVELNSCWYEGGLERLFREHVSRFTVVQCSDFTVGEELLLNRRVPGDGDMPLEWLMATLLDAGYAGYFDLEMLGPAIETEGYASAIRRGADWLSERLTRWGV